MTIYVVGGAVRDMLLDNPSKDVDYVVTNVTVKDMLNDKYKQVGNEFPVFLHPVTGDEYALARTERKIGTGYNGFSFETDGITIEQDLMRRDLTINAMAIEPQHFVNYDCFKGNQSVLIDPTGGYNDLQDGILRHINADAFKEDPVRVLRIARFLARWPDFRVAPETQALCEEMVASGELNHLTSERIVKEFLGALTGETPSRFFLFLEMIGALKILFPEVHALIGQTQPFKYHPEGDSFIHTMLVMDLARNGLGPYVENGLLLCRFAALTHDFGKGLTPKHKLPHHYGHEAAGVGVIESFAARLPLSNDLVEHAKIVAKYHMHIHNFRKLKHSTIVDMFYNLKPNKNKHINKLLPYVSAMDAKGRGPFYERLHYNNEVIARAVFSELSDAKLSKFLSQDEIDKLSVDQIKKFLLNKHVEIVKKWMNPA